jgi:predicted nucleic acid-binding protein
VIVLDANILLYAYGSASPLHKEARTWLEKTLSGTEPAGLPGKSITAFIR